MHTNKHFVFSHCILIFLMVLVLDWHLVLGCSSSEPDEYRVLRKTDSGGKQLVVAIEENAKLFCRTNVPWKKCIWKPPRNGVREVYFNSIIIQEMQICKRMNEVKVQVTFSKYFSSDVNSRNRLPGIIIAQVFLKFILTRQKVTSTPIIVQLMLRKSKNTTMEIGSVSLSLIFQKKVKLYTLKNELKWWREDTDIHESNNPYFIR